MTDSSGFGDDMMLEMFREEAEMQLGELSDGLIALETSDSSDELLERLMRAAHSMKGAARIMGIDPIVKLTHVARRHLCCRSARGIGPESRHYRCPLGNDRFHYGILRGWRRS
jgi:Chemotaxis protein histidine kinase and related kinases